MARFAILFTFLSGTLGCLSLANASMPLLTPKPKTLSDATCRAWAAKQDSDAIDMWGIQEDGTTSRSVALYRLSNDCLGHKAPDIVGFGSSAGFDDEYCHRHSNVKLCKNNNNSTAADSDRLNHSFKNADGDQRFNGEMTINGRVVQMDIPSNVGQSTAPIRNGRLTEASSGHWTVKAENDGHGGTVCDAFASGQMDRPQYEFRIRRSNDSLLLAVSYSGPKVKPFSQATLSIENKEQTVSAQDGTETINSQDRSTIIIPFDPNFDLKIFQKDIPISVKVNNDEFRLTFLEEDRVADKMAECIRSQAFPPLRIVAKKEVEKSASNEAAAMKDKIEKEIALSQTEGPKFLAESETAWTFNSTRDKFSGSTITRVVSQQKNDNGVVAEVAGKCLDGNIIFSALIVDESGHPNVSIVRNSLLNTYGGQLANNAASVRIRLNNDIYNGAVATEEFTNKFTVLKIIGPIELNRLNHLDKGERVGFLLQGMMLPMMQFNAAWGANIEFSTNNGPIVVSIPMFDESIKKLFSECFNHL